MPKGDYLGEFEHLLLLAIIREDGEAFGLSIRDAVMERTGRFVATGAIYVTLERLERKGLVRSEIEQGGIERDSRRRRRYRITKDGLRAVSGTQRALRNMSRGLNVAFE